jgi:hypothetical protein
VVVRAASQVSSCLSPDDGQLAVTTENQLIHLWDLRQLRRGLGALGLDWGKPTLASD